MESRSSIKFQAREIMKGKYQNPVIILVIFGVIDAVINGLSTKFAPQYDYSVFPYVMTDPGIPSLVTLLNIVSIVVFGGLIYSVMRMAIQIVKQEEIDIAETLSSGFKNEYPRNIFLYFMRSLFIALWTILLIIPGIVKAYAYSMSFYLVNREKDLTAMDAISKSKVYMDGYKSELFVLDLSYLGWYFIGLFTLGILWLWIIPQHLAARVMYYDAIYLKNNPLPKSPEPLVEE